ncbi:synaptic vesicle 2-related protein [Caerostris extrusa]|uniref:Synaptic vesicle 2-related protein n=1 Tax=Caerostris extrusa TaxID=172846 RepID=A0AAV4P7S5_CAEEX|nr:synaptic vesicle 2-related protein [Caerostris extrusa]
MKYNKLFSIKFVIFIPIFRFNIHSRRCSQQGWLWQIPNTIADIGRYRMDGRRVRDLHPVSDRGFPGVRLALVQMADSLAHLHRVRGHHDWQSHIWNSRRCIRKEEILGGIPSSAVHIRSRECSLPLLRVDGRLQRVHGVCGRGTGAGGELTLCTEYCPTSMRGKAGLYLCYFWSLGTCLVTLLAWLIMEYLDSWRILLLIVSLPCLMGVIAMKWFPESARYYLVSGQRDKAIDILQQMAKMNGCELPPGQLVHVSEEQKLGRVKDLLSKEYRLSSFLFWYIWLATAFAYYGIALVSPIIITEGSFTKGGNDTNSTFFEDLSSHVQCSSLTSQNYIDLLWTSAAEFPGEGWNKKERGGSSTS